MMYFTNRVKGFTLQELLIVMLLSSIIMYGIYQGMNYILLHFYKFDHQISEKDIFLMERNMLKRDFYESDSVYVLYDGFVCYSGNKKIIYETNERKLKRFLFKESKVYTFKYPISKINFQYDGYRLFRHDHKIDYVNLVFDIKGMDISVILNKWYDMRARRHK